jgi:hypothetical protein
LGAGLANRVYSFDNSKNRDELYSTACEILETDVVEVHSSM